DTSSSFVFNNSKIAQQYGGFRKFINEKEIYQQGKYPLPYKKRHLHRQLAPRQRDTTFNGNKFPAGIRAGFYVDWDAQSLSSLEKYITKLNLVIPEWLFIDPRADTVYTSIDAHALDVMKKAGIKIMPILSNNYKDTFRGDAVHRIIHTPAKRQKLIT